LKHSGEDGARVYVGVGSNINPEANIRTALKLLRERVSVVAVSAFFRSKPAGTVDQPDFINGIFKIKTELSPALLKFDVLRGIEAALGRARSLDKNAARTIDLDIVLYGGLVLEEPGLSIPDPGLVRYPFVALPLLELEPDIVVPGTNELLKNIFPDSPLSYGLREVHFIK
jgi:dihydroneopterin aldolase/2-amino-4-hydroxy-6-hydroxymethyldihydropteridine diphosphokinase